MTEVTVWKALVFVVGLFMLGMMVYSAIVGSIINATYYGVLYLILNSR